MRCVLQFDECFLLQCEKERESEREKEKEGERIPPHPSLTFPAAASTVAYTCAQIRTQARAHKLPKKKKNAYMHARGNLHGVAGGGGGHKACTHREGERDREREKEGESASVTQRGEIRLLCNSEICNLHVNNPWSAASPGGALPPLSASPPPCSPRAHPLPRSAQTSSPAPSLHPAPPPHFT